MKMDKHDMVFMNCYFIDSWTMLLLGMNSHKYDYVTWIFILLYELLDMYTYVPLLPTEFAAHSSQFFVPGR